MPPRQPRLGQNPSAGVASTTSHESDSVRVRVNDTSKVSPLSDDSSEPHASSSRFAAWQRRRRGATSSAAEPEPEPDPAPGSHEPPYQADTVVAFPPRARRRRRRWVTLLAALVMGVLFVGILFFSPLFAAREFRVEGARLTNTGTVQEALRQFEGVPLTRISKDRVREAVGDVPQVNSVDVVLQPPHTVTVQLHERVGVATVKEGSELILVDSQGKQLATYTTADGPDVPAVEGGREVLSTEKFADIAEVLSSLPADVLSQLDGAGAPSDSSVELTFEDGRKVVWGDSTDSELKARVLAALVSHEDTASGTVYDVSAPLHPAVR